MPRWVNIRERWSSYRNRLDLNHRFGEMLTGVLPVVSLERSWPTEQLSMYGMNVECAGAGGAAHFACSLHNVSDENPPAVELLVWRVNAWHFRPGLGTLTPSASMHLFSPIASYNPHSIPATLPIHAPWLQTGAESGDKVQLSRAHGDAGFAPALQVVSIGGVATTSIGPILTQPVRLISPTTVGSVFQGGSDMVEFQPQYPAPPIRVLPGRRLTVQTTTTFSSSAYLLEANFWWSERLFEPGS